MQVGLEMNDRVSKRKVAVRSRQLVPVGTELADSGIEMGG